MASYADTLKSSAAQSFAAPSTTNPTWRGPMWGQIRNGASARPPAPAAGSGPTSEARTGKGHFGAGGDFTSTAGGTNQPAAAPQSPYGSQSGPGILENWFNQRASGTDPGYEYAMNRGMNDIDNRMAAGGSYNSGARGQQLGDYAANMGAQREGQLDALAGGASGEHLGRLGLMFNQGNQLAQGQSGLASAYDLGAAGNMAAANQAQQQMYLNKAGVDSQAAQGRVNTLISAYGAYNGGKSSGG